MCQEREAKDDAATDSGAKKYDWKTIEQEYVLSQAEPSLRKLEEKYSCSHGAMQRHSSKGHWAEKRKLHWANVGTTVAQKLVETQAERLARHLKFARYAQQRCLQAISTGTVRYSFGDLSRFIQMERMLCGEENYNEATRQRQESQMSQEEAAAILAAIVKFEEEKEKQVERERKAALRLSGHKRRPTRGDSHGTNNPALPPDREAIGQSGRGYTRG